MRVPGALAVAETAAGCATWDAIAAACRGCTACAELADSRQTVVVGDVPPGARVLLVGEAPGAEEDAAGRPFVGKAGRLLNELLAEAGLDRESVAVLNVLQCRPPRNRTPYADEIGRCRGWLERKLELLEPEVICTLGLTAATWFLGRGVKLGQARSQVHNYAGRKLVVTYHPSAAIRFGPAGAPRAALREDLKVVAGLLDRT